MKELYIRDGEQRTIQYVMTTPEINEIVADIISGKAVRVSDGSFKDIFGIAS